MKRYVDLFKQTWKEFGDDKAQRLGAALAYYTVFSIAPLLLITISIAGMVFGKQASQGALQHQLSGALGANTAKALNDMVLNASKPKSGTLAMVIGIVTLLFGAAGVFGQLQDALDTIWNVEKPNTGGFIGLIKDRFLSMAMVFGIGFLLLVTLVIDTVISTMGHFVGSRLPGGEAMLQIAQLVVSFGLITLLFALTFRYLPHTRVEWKDVWFGAAFTAFLFVLGKFGLSLYIGKAAVGSAYGAAGSLVIILVWVYWSAQILFFGAEFTQVYSRRQGSKAGDTSKEKQRVEERPKARIAPVPGAAKSGGGKKLAAGGVLGLILGGIIGGIVTTFVAIKSVKKLITFPFK